MTLRGILAVQEAFNRSGRGKGQSILLDFVEQDAPARAHSLELNMPLACLLKLPALARIPLADLLAHTRIFVNALEGVFYCRDRCRFPTYIFR